MKLEIGDVVKQRRVELKMEQEALAKACGLSQSTISQVENKTKKLSLDSLEKVCEALGLKIQLVPK